MRSRTVITVVFAGVFVACVAAVLITMGSRGGEIADVLSAAIGALSLTAAVVNLLGATPNGSGVPRKRPRRHKRMWVATAVVFTIAGLGVAGYSLFVVKPDLPVTDQMTITESEMRIGAQATIHVPGTPPERRYFAFVPTLVNPSTVGDCAGSARLRITLVVDGRIAHQETGRIPGQEIPLDLGEVTRDAKVHVTADLQDPACVVQLGVSAAVLYN